ncbi:protein of unknown function [Paraburkholderia dioscoreae]|uniref:Uncharacterized protein n=1 Tax=Paraburkholderia dioscoreae TaxID=2604047 RepID=A0A5Q4YWG6_9BURK|nr:protein of unknown function [Paraburkholderia dioscoreae]
MSCPGTRHTLANSTHALPIAIATPYGMVPVALLSATLPDLRRAPFPGVAQSIRSAAIPLSPAHIWRRRSHMASDPIAPITQVAKPISSAP